jgi:hypothetical protein
MSRELGRREPTDWRHVERYPLQALLADPVHPLGVAPPGTEKSLGLPWWWKSADQGAEGSCVGWACSHMMSVTNRYQRRLATGKDVTYRYASRWLYGEAQLIDEWPETPPAEGTSVRAGCEILRARGHRRVQGGIIGPENVAHGVSAYRWATSHDEVRAALYAGLAVAIGINWYFAFEAPYEQDGERWISIPLGNKIRGGHAVCLFRMSDRREGFRLMNSWGAAYPPVWIGYDTLDRLLSENGEAAVISDR